MGPGFAIYGEHTWGGHADATPSRRPATSCARPASADVGGVRGLPAGVAHGLPDAAPGPPAGRARRCSSSGSARACRAPRWRSPATSAPRSSPPAAARPSGPTALAMGAAAAIDSADERWPVQADVVVESVGAATWERVGAGAQAGRPAGRVRRDVGGRASSSTCPGCSSSSTRSSARRWAATRSSPR